ncbi:hypothetical protein SGODD07_01613 [Streptococcus gordonii]|uniref:Uncharacterized protein n=1 Tax=Streptococcus gordonii TaxID=1302 RepID=A0A139N2I0_STRGN|nr:hypothetical protein SGODD07_01613 [Streptococcus gordonii]
MIELKLVDKSSFQVVLAGYMKIAVQTLLDRYEGRMTVWKALKNASMPLGISYIRRLWKEEKLTLISNQWFDKRKILTDL